MIEVYIPLLHYLGMAEKLDVAMKYTISFSPPLLEMMHDPVLQEKFSAELERMLALADTEVDRTSSVETILDSLHH